MAYEAVRTAISPVANGAVLTSVGGCMNRSPTCLPDGGIKKCTSGLRPDSLDDSSFLSARYGAQIKRESVHTTYLLPCRNW